MLREHIELIHAHAALSSLGHEAILHGHLLGVRTVFTDHSLFGFEDAASILTNKLLAATLANVDAVICVSHTGYEFALCSSLKLLTVFRRENTVLRSGVDPSITHVIPNAIIADQFKPSNEPLPRDSGKEFNQRLEQY